MSPITMVRESLVDLVRDPRHTRRGNTVFVGATSILLVIAVFAASMALLRLWYVLRTDHYAAEFANAGGVRTGDPVLVAGVPSGRVDSLTLEHGLAVVGFRLDRGQDLGEASTATIGLKSILGNRFLEVTPAGGGDLGPHRRIGVERTTSPYMIDDIGGAVTDLAEELDTRAVSAMIDSLDSILPQDAGAAGQSIDDVSAALGLLAREDARMSGVVTTTRELTGVLVSQEAGIRALTDQSLVLVTVLTQRREALSSLVSSLEDLATRVRVLLDEEAEDVDRVLGNMRSISETYQRNIDAMDEVLTRMPPGLRAVTDAAGNGPWTDVATPTGPIPDSALCALGVMDGCN
ncbi:MAG: MlaD family protein [Dietzia sp.]|uniref:MCE family protein n=1 Tax=unclassified Dietzia TaxID=2617939 RepID=UPI0015FD5951|nr:MULTISPECIES: MlaD family protein [unclassified Dietzia]MBB1041164.1 MCE family protein [Dietzia sp. Cai40]MBB1046149.1 MCE family protein [Dietzia sp. DQ11-44]MBB1050093.1 MCE family protein [Dietzia sp. CW19]MBB1056642.1 MCE family protein [Dietzia sp. B19]MBC7296405.1 MCE family protein [Dietzia sp.]